MNGLGRKNLLASNLCKIKKARPKDFEFYPMTWMLPAEIAEFRGYMSRKRKWYIVKP